MCNPILTFSCTVTKANSEPTIDITHYIDPKEDRSLLPSVLMPIEILSDVELDLIKKKQKKMKFLKW